MKVLVIDRVDSSREHVVRRLRELFPGAEIFATGSEREGLEIALSETRFDAVLVADYRNISGRNSQGAFIINMLADRYSALADRVDTPLALMTSEDKEVVRGRCAPDRTHAWQSFEAPHELYRLLKKRDRQNPRPARRGF